MKKNLTARDAWNIIQKNEDEHFGWFAQQWEMSEKDAVSLIVFWSINDFKRFSAEFDNLKNASI